MIKMKNGRSAPEPDVPDLVKQLLEGLGLSPDQMPPSHVNSLRGGQAFFNLVDEDLDGVLMLSRSSTEIGSGGVRVRDASDRLYRLDYAVRGNIRGVLPRRIIAAPFPVVRGMLRKSVDSIVWQTPREGTPSVYQSSGAFDDEQPPGPGEVFGGSPYEVIAVALNGDPELKNKLIGLATRKGSSLIPRIVTDRWGDSIRLQACRWTTLGGLPLTYAARDYVDIVASIAKHVREVRRVFGGVSF